MRAIEITHPGPADVLKLCERPMPVVKTGEVLIKVHAAGVNRPDVFQRLGNYAPPPGASDIPGLEVAGEIVDGDLDYTTLDIGDQVCALVQGGGYAEYVVAPIQQVLPVPKGWSMLEAATIPENYFTVWSNVFDRANLSAGETLLVQGGSSGIGVTAIQLASAMGHRVFATAGSDDKVAACVGRGAPRRQNYKTEDFGTIVKSLTNDRGVDVILDMVAGDYLPREVSCLADDGRIAIIATLGGAKATLDMAQVLRRRLTVTGSTLRPRSVEFKGAIAKKLKERVWPMMAERKLKPVIHTVFPLEQAAAAHALMESSSHVGKIMLQVI
jgi:NADPH2:quinone reductase